MKVSYKWLKEYILTNKKPQQLAQDLESLGHEVENIIFENNDTIFDINITANRNDCLSIFGIARELAALYNTKIIQKKTTFKINSKNNQLKIKLTNKDICQQINLRLIENIKIKPSDKETKEKLISYGFKPINNVVDATNLVMIETGQPIHAFDYDKISGNLFNIELAKNGESIITLDGKERSLDNQTIVINNNSKIYDLSGIMGAFNSEIDENTRNIVIQTANFNPILIRRTSKRLKLVTDASYRFERGIDPSNCIYANNLCTDYLYNKNKEIKISPLKSQSFPIKKIKIDFNYDKINHLLGINLTKKQIDNYLNRLNIKVQNNFALIPSYRSRDLDIWQSLAEEVARLYGYNKLGIKYIEKIDKPKTQANQYNHIEKIKDILINYNFDEINSYSFTDEKLLKTINQTKQENYEFSKIQKVINSINPKNNYLRPSLFSSIVTAVSKNPWAPEINIFEIGKIHYDLKERYQLCLATTQKKAQNIKQFLDDYNLSNKIIKIDQKILDYLKIRKKVSIVLINDIRNISVDNLNYNKSLPEKKYHKISSFPPTIRDISIILNKKYTSENILNTIYDSDKHIFIVELFDEYISDKLGKNNKSLAFHVWLQDKHKPLSKDESQDIIKNIINKLSVKYKARLR